MANNQEDSVDQTTKPAKSGSQLLCRFGRGRAGQQLASQAGDLGRERAGQQLAGQAGDLGRGHASQLGRGRAGYFGTGLGRGRARGRARGRGAYYHPKDSLAGGVPGMLVHPVFAPVLRPPVTCLPEAPAGSVNTGYYDTLLNFSSLEYFKHFNSYVVDRFAYTPPLQGQPARAHFAIRSALDLKPLCIISAYHDGDAKMTNLTGTVTLCTADNMFDGTKYTHVVAGPNNLGTLTSNKILGHDGRTWGFPKYNKDEEGKLRYFIANNRLMVHIRSLSIYQRLLVQCHPGTSTHFKILSLIYTAKIRKFFDNELSDPITQKVKDDPIELFNILSVKDAIASMLLPAMAKPFEVTAGNPDLSELHKMFRIRIAIAAKNHRQRKRFYYIRSASDEKVLLTAEINDFYPCRSITVKSLPTSDVLFTVQRYFANHNLAQVRMFYSFIGKVDFESNELIHTPKPPHKVESIKGQLGYQDANQQIWYFHERNISLATIGISSDHTVSMEISKTDLRNRVAMKALFFSFALLKVAEQFDEKDYALQLPTCTDIINQAKEHNRNL